MAAFRLLPYLAREQILLPLSALDIDTAKLRELEETELVDDDEAMPEEDSADEST